MALRVPNYFVLKLAFLLLISYTYQANAEVLINLSTGKQTHAEDLINAGHALIYIEHDCSACHQYIKDVALCQKEVVSKVVYVSISSASLSKALARKLHQSQSLYILKDIKRPAFLSATPTTLSSKGNRIGILKCDSLKKLI